MSGTDNMAARTAELRRPAIRQAGSPSAVTFSWIASAFLVSLTLAAIVLARYGAAEPGATQALRATARWCFVLFLPAYAGGALARFGGPRFAVFARHGRDFGLAFAAALTVHVALVLWHLHVTGEPAFSMLFFWAGVFATYALALFSLPRLRQLLGPRLWRIGCELALQYIALVFADDFILEPLNAAGPDKYPLSYLPFVVLLVGGAILRVAARLRRQPATDA